MAIEEFAFPESDHEWMSLQQHIIDLTGKTIEDFACGELGTLRAALTAAEMNAVLSYRRRKRLESSAAFDGVKAVRRDPEGWEDWKCNKTYEWMLAFQSDMRALLLSISYLSRVGDENCQRALLEVQRELSFHLKGYPDRAWDPGAGYNWLLHNVERVFPNDEGLELLNKWHGQLDKLEDQLKPVKPAPPKDSWLEILCRRSGDLEKICDKAMKAGLVSSRGSHLYFNGRYIGNGLHNSVWRIVREDYELEAEIRTAVKKAAGTRAPTRKVPARKARA